jgi:hypothetical protein
VLIATRTVMVRLFAGVMPVCFVFWENSCLRNEPHNGHVPYLNDKVGINYQPQHYVESVLGVCP